MLLKVELNQDVSASSSPPSHCIKNQKNGQTQDDQKQTNKKTKKTKSKETLLVKVKPVDNKIFSCR